MSKDQETNAFDVQLLRLDLLVLPASHNHVEEMSSMLQERLSDGSTD